MKRRTYATSVVTAFTGIAGYIMNRTGNAENPPENPPMRKVTDTTVSGLGSTNIEIDASIEQAEITSEATAKISLSVTWDGQEKQKLVFGNSLPFDSPQKSSNPSGLLLIDEASDIAQHDKRRDEETWVPITGDDNEIPINLNLVMGTFEPGQSKSQMWEVWADPSEASWIKPGTYTFDSEIGVKNDEVTQSAHLTLTVNIEEP
ncbi:hypothetical protein ACFQE1_01640 [Halobium palmae]|uniref:Bacterial Ig-like domain-containing protein n=1 Tax=Halobium palmae TaxID=1776492 RepID=A0ABD5RUR3_9EURY